MNIIQPCAVALAAVLMLSTTPDAEAARLRIVSAGTAVDLIDQSASIDTIDTTRLLTGGLVDASGADTVLLSDFQAFAARQVGTATVEDGHSHLVAVDASGASTDLTLDAAHFWRAHAAAPVTLDRYSLVQSLSHEGLRLRIEGDVGEAVGQAVSVRFNGQADALLGGVADSAQLGLTMDALQGASTLASYNGLWTDPASEGVSLGFMSRVGDEFTVSLSAVQSRTSAQHSLMGNTELSGNLLLQGSFTVTAVPEPGTWCLALAGLITLAWRRRAR